MEMKTKIAIGVGVLAGGYVLYSMGKSSTSSKKTTKSTTSPPPGAPIPTPDAPEPKPPVVEPPGPEGGAAPTVVTERDFESSDNTQLSMPVKGQILNNGDGTFTVRFTHANGFEEYDHHTLDGAEMRLDSTVNQPSEWTCATNYDEAFDAWVCTAGVNVGDVVARGFIDKAEGPAPWWVTWNGAKFMLTKMGNLLSDPVEVNQFDTLLAAMQTAVGTSFEAVAVE